MKKGTKAGLIISTVLCVIAPVGEVMVFVNLNNSNPQKNTFISLGIVIIIFTTLAFSCTPRFEQHKAAGL